MFENIKQLLKKIGSKEANVVVNSRNAAKERLHLVLMQDRANVSVDFLELMKQEIIEVIKKYIEVDENAIDVRLTNKENTDGTNGAPALYANIPIVNMKNDVRKVEVKESIEKKEEIVKEKKAEEKKTVKKKEVIDKDNKEEISKEEKTEVKENTEIKKEEIVEEKEEKINQKEEILTEKENIEKENIEKPKEEVKSKK